MLRFFFRIVVCLLLLAAVWLGGAVWYAQQIPTESREDDLSTDAIVVLTGGTGRINYGLNLLADGRARMLFITGMESQTTPRVLVRNAGIDNVVTSPEQVINLGFDARNTIGNAMETASWMRRERLHSLRLVTSNYHMPRALNEFRQAMPDVSMVPDPVISPKYQAANWWKGGNDTTLFLQEYHKYLASKLRHWLIAAVEEDK